jgi:hypothetical protein
MRHIDYTAVITVNASQVTTLPIAQCIVDARLVAGGEDPAELWCKESGIACDEMTINIIRSVQQFGKPCPVIAQLMLPSLWAAPEVTLLQTGLARALARHFNLTADQVLVITRTVVSGHVVDDGQEVSW